MLTANPKSVLNPISPMFKKIAIVLSLLFLAAAPAAASAAATGGIDVVMFWGQGCPHCTAMESFLTQLKSEYPTLKVHAFEVFQSEENRNLLLAYAAAYDTQVTGVPALFIGSRVIKGNLQEEVRSAVEDCRLHGCPSPLTRVAPAQPPTSPEPAPPADATQASQPPATTGAAAEPRSVRAAPPLPPAAVNRDESAATEAEDSKVPDELSVPAETAAPLVPALPAAETASPESASDKFHFPPILTVALTVIVLSGAGALVWYQSQKS
jgi:glutaredoxin